MKLQLLNGSLVRLQLRHTRHYRTNRLLLLFHATSAMMPRAQSVIAHLPVLRQNWETLDRLGFEAQTDKPPPT
jgi:hypothetical protein